MPSKKIVSRKLNKNFIETTDETKDIATKALAKEVAAPKTEIEIPTREAEEHVEQEKPVVKESLPPSAETIVESLTEEISKRKRRKRLMPVAFRLPRPCKVGVCKPDICCRGKLSTRYGVDLQYCTINESPWLEYCS